MPAPLNTLRYSPPRRSSTARRARMCMRRICRTMSRARLSTSGVRSQVCQRLSIIERDDGLHGAMPFGAALVAVLGRKLGLELLAGFGRRLERIRVRPDARLQPREESGAADGGLTMRGG